MVAHVRGAADKAACLAGWKSPHRQFPVRTVSKSDACGGNDTCSARRKTSQLPRGVPPGGGSDLGDSKPGGLNVKK